MEQKSKKELHAQYKEREVAGGVYAIRNTLKNKLFVDATADLPGSKNRFEFAVQTGSCILPKLQVDWNGQKGQGFEFEVLEELKKGELQTAAGFKEDLKLIRQMWLEKLSNENMY